MEIYVENLMLYQGESICLLLYLEVLYIELFIQPR